MFDITMKLDILAKPTTQIPIVICHHMKDNTKQKKKYKHT